MNKDTTILTLIVLFLAIFFGGSLFTVVSALLDAVLTAGL